MFPAVSCCSATCVLGFCAIVTKVCVVHTAKYINEIGEMQTVDWYITKPPHFRITMGVSTLWPICCPFVYPFNRGIHRYHIPHVNACTLSARNNQTMCYWAGCLALFRLPCLLGSNLLIYLVYIYNGKKAKHYVALMKWWKNHISRETILTDHRPGAGREAGAEINIAKAWEM